MLNPYQLKTLRHAVANGGKQNGYNGEGVTLCAMDYGGNSPYNWRIAFISGGHTYTALKMEGFVALGIKIVLLDPVVDKCPDLIRSFVYSKNDTTKKGLAAQFLEIVPLLASMDKDYASYRAKQQNAGAGVLSFEAWVEQSIPEQKGKAQ
eukprot:g18248.t1